MPFKSTEDRLNPIAPEDVDETTLGGYASVYGRAAAFQGSDGEAYTAAVEAEPSERGDSWVAYLVFLRWAANGTAVMGHLETGDLVEAATEDEARAALDALPLASVRSLLDQAIQTKHTE